MSMTRRRRRPWPQGVQKNFGQKKLRAESAFPKKGGLSRRGGNSQELGSCTHRPQYYEICLKSLWNLWVYVGINKELLHKNRKTNCCNRCTHDHTHWESPIWDLSPRKKPHLGNPQVTKPSCRHPLVSVCAPVCCKNLCCPSRFCTGGRE